MCQAALWAKSADIDDRNIATVHQKSPESEPNHEETSAFSTPLVGGGEACVDV
jgi:hypothetical protein